MSLTPVLHAWQHEVDQVLPQMPLRQRRVLALFSLGVAQAQHCSLGRAAAAVPTTATDSSVVRRFGRFLANPRIDVPAAQSALSQAVLRWTHGTTVRLALDETHQGHTATGAALCLLAVRLLYRGRAIPLVAVCHRPGEQTDPYPVLIARLLAQVATWVPVDTRVVLLTDRGLSWPQVLDACRALHWSFLGRVQGQTHLRTPDGVETPVAARVPVPGTAWVGTGQVFKKAGWRNANIVAVWPPAQAHPWLLVTDLPATRQRCTDYRRRMWEEESFRDDKRGGLHWEQSRVRHPAHATRLVLVLQLALCFLLALGSQVIKRGWRALLERRDRRELSLCTLGLRWLRRQLTHGAPLVPRLVFYFH
jgi:hypothetical protein